MDTHYTTLLLCSLLFLLLHNYSYGSDTIRVTLFLEVPWDTPDLSPVSFTVEMHSLDYMPHSVLTFLEQVEHGLWDNTYFMTNAPHILLSSTVQDVKSKPYNYSHLSAFQDVGLDHLLFQEYHDHYPHKSMTLGFAGRPAGPNFYINKIDNTVIHGPGGQAHHDIDEEADPCFATVVGGKEILMRIFALPVQQGDSYELFRPVKITRAFVHPKAEMENQEYHDEETEHDTESFAHEYIKGYEPIEVEHDSYTDGVVELIIETSFFCFGKKKRNYAT